MNDPNLLKLKDDLRSLMSAELQLLDMIIHLLQDRGATEDKEAEEIIRTTLLMYQGLGVSIHSILKLTEVPDMGIRDCFSIARGVVETSINIAYIVSSNSEVAQKAQAHALQRFYRDLSKVGTIAGTRISVSSSAIPSIESIPGLEQALKQFTDKNGREIRDWCSKTQNEKIEVVQALSKKAALSLAGAKFAIYRNSSELLHGTYFGTLYFWMSPETGAFDKDGFFYRWVHNHLMTIFTAAFLGGLGAVQAAAVRFSEPPVVELIRQLRAKALEIVEPFEQGGQ